MNSNEISYLGFTFENCEVIAIDMDDVVFFSLDEIVEHDSIVHNFTDNGYRESSHRVSNSVYIEIKHNTEVKSIDEDRFDVNYIDYPGVDESSVPRILNRKDIVYIDLLDKNFHSIETVEVPWKEEDPNVLGSDNTLQSNSFSEPYSKDNSIIYYTINIDK